MGRKFLLSFFLLGLGRGYSQTQRDCYLSYEECVSQPYPIPDIGWHETATKVETKN